MVTCRVLRFSPQGFYRWRKNPVCNRDWDDARLVDAALAIHADDPVFGYRFIADELAAEHGITAGENRVHRLCAQRGIASVIFRRRGKGLLGDLAPAVFAKRWRMDHRPARLSQRVDPETGPGHNLGCAPLGSLTTPRPWLREPAIMFEPFGRSRTCWTGKVATNGPRRSGQWVGAGCIKLPAGRRAVMAAWRKKRGSVTWHHRVNCSNYPQSDYTTSPDHPTSRSATSISRDMHGEWTEGRP